ncbi:hypothetical protein KFK09_004986 [Dendrobium nobile]|uniref:Uncharacterized protein n=1 Tax=Dendrobium nobile TaxID=94219 RepID=A0A8T3BZC4_DENNO|nr:hypothetical protein KFK09_004986 [Dendrobium nobile]
MWHLPNRGLGSVYIFHLESVLADWYRSKYSSHWKSPPPKASSMWKNICSRAVLIRDKLWREKNNRHFNGNGACPLTVINSIKFDLRYKVSAWKIYESIKDSFPDILS